MAECSTVTFDCPICGVTIPIPHLDRVTAFGLTAEWDDSYAVEHTVMHADCICDWTNNTAKTGMIITAYNDNCRFHGDGTLRYCTHDGCHALAVTTHAVEPDLRYWVCEDHR